MFSPWRGLLILSVCLPYLYCPWALAVDCGV